MTVASHVQCTTAFTHHVTIPLHADLDARTVKASRSPFHNPTVSQALSFVNGCKEAKYLLRVRMKPALCIYVFPSNIVIGESTP